MYTIIFFQTNQYYKYLSKQNSVVRIKYRQVPTGKCCYCPLLNILKSSYGNIVVAQQ